MKLKYGDFILYKESIGQVCNPGVNQECISINWLHFSLSQPPLAYYQPKSFADKCEVLPKDVGENLLEVLKRNEQ